MVYLPEDLADDAGYRPVSIVAPAYPPRLFTGEDREAELDGVGLLGEQPRIALPIEPLPEIPAVPNMPPPGAAPPAIGASSVKTTTTTVTKPAQTWLPLWATILIPVIGLPLAWWLWRRRRKKKPA